MLMSYRERAGGIQDALAGSNPQICANTDHTEGGHESVRLKNRLFQDRSTKAK